MKTSERQRGYNKKWRDKQAKIKKLGQELDAMVAAMEKLPRCTACESAQVACGHTKARHQALELIEIHRGWLRDLEH